MQFITYRKFTEQSQADALIQVLRDNQIECETAEDRDSLDSLYGAKVFNRHFFVKIKQQDFAKADALLQEQSEKEVETVDQEHYLFSFTDDELFEILYKPDEWSEFDHQLARKLLKEKGRDISPETIELLKRQRIKELAKPEQESRIWIYAGYIFSLLGGWIGIAIGLILVTAKKTLPDGQRVYTYPANDRNHGILMFTIGLIMLALSVILWIKGGFNPWY
jgi:hypothetical protein